jgi:hypothetical protein
MKKSWFWAAVPLSVMCLTSIALPQLLPHGRAWLFLISAALLAGEFAVIGALINDRPIGAFIDNRNLLSLSKLQAGAWTVIVLSALATAAAYNAVGPGHSYATVAALNVVIPDELLLAMGISATSLVAAPALLSLKAAEAPQAHAAQGAANRTKKTVVGNGKLLTKQTAKDASWADLVTGEELGNAGTPDLGKIQQGFITLILLGAYSFYIFQYFGSNIALITQLPTVDKSFVWLLGLSHGTYLAYKAAPHTASANQALTSKATTPEASSQPNSSGAS